MRTLKSITAHISAPTLGEPSSTVTCDLDWDITDLDDYQVGRIKEAFGDFVELLAADSVGVTLEIEDDSKPTTTGA